jgi:glycosyltransferase involved in cell wall biosynthesis
MSAERLLRTVQVSSSDVGGGAERVAADLHRGSLERGLDSRLAVGFRFGAIPGTVEIPNDADRSPWARAVLSTLPGLPAPPARLSSSAVLVRRALKTLAEPGRALRRSQGYEDFDYPGTAALSDLGGAPADVLHLHGLHGGYFDLRHLPRLSEHVPTVVTLHDTWLTSGHCAYTLECERWRTGCGDCPHLDTHPAVPRDRTAENWALKRDILGRSRLHVVGPSRWVLGKAADSILAAGAVEMRHIPNGVDRSVFAPGDRRAARAQLGIPNDALVLLFSAAARTNLYKDVATIAAALPAIAARVAPRPVLFVSLGASVDSASIAGVDVLPVPFLPDSRDVARHLQAADLVLHAARAENHPLAVLEAQSCGIPVVATDVGGVPETLVDRRTGLLVPPDDPAALADAASGLLLDDGRRAAFGEAAAGNAAAHFGLDCMLDAYVALYRELGSAS